MIVLGVESTAHTIGVGIVENNKVLSNEKSIYKPPIGWGIKPQEAANHHAEQAPIVLQKALDSANLELKDIDVLSFSQGTGIPLCLHEGRKFIIELAKKTKKPIYGINHQVSHIEIGKLTTGFKDGVVVYVSGGNSQIISRVGDRYSVFGETSDIGVGNAFDKFAREVSIGFPGGPEIEKLSMKGKWIDMPYTVKGMDLAFSGIVADATRKAKKEALEDVCFSFQETCFSMVVEVSERALAHLGKREILLTGGVAANKRLQEMLEIMCNERGAKFHSVPKEYAMDNGAMIAYTGWLAFKSGQKPFDPNKDNINSTWRTDEVEVLW